MKSKKVTIYQLTFMAMMAAVTCILGPLSVPIGQIPISLTNLVIYFTVFVLGIWAGTGSYGIYLLLGAVGLPVFSGFAGGLGKLLGPTGGFLIGFLHQSQQVSLLGQTALMVKSARGKLILYSIANIIGAAWCLALGTIWLSLVARLSLQVAFKSGFLPFIIPGLPKLPT